MELAFFDRVRKLCKVRNTTIEAVANSAGLTRGAYNSYRSKGHLPRANEAVLMAQELGTTVEYLVTGNQVAGITENLANLMLKVSLLDEDDLDDITALVQSKIDRKQKKRLPEISESMGSAI